MTSVTESITLPCIQRAAAKIAPFINRTPCLHSDDLSRLFGCEVYLKLENLQVTGAFKIRGNAYKMAITPDKSLANGVITASSGNHGLGLSLSAIRRGTSAVVVVPHRTPANKVNKLRAYGAQVVLHGDSYDEAVDRANELAEATGRLYVPSFDDPDIVMGNATIGLEIHEDVPDATAVICPIGGGGAISGICLALKRLAPGVRVIGVQAEGAPSMVRSLRAGVRVKLDKTDTLADGIAVRQPGSITFQIVRDLVSEVVLVSDRSMRQASSLLADRCKVVSEFAGAASVAAIPQLNERLRGEKVVCLVSGGNIDLNLLCESLSTRAARSSAVRPAPWGAWPASREARS